MRDHANIVREALGLFYSMAASGEKPSPRSEYVRDESRAALDALVAERDGLRKAGTKVADAYTAEAEDHTDGEFALWKADDLVNAIVALRAALGEDA